MNAPGTDRDQLARLLDEALEAMERGDEDGWRRRVQLLADSPSRNVVRRLGRLAPDLEQSLAALPPDPVPGRLDDAGARLDHVVAMTEQATHRTLDLIDDSRALVARLKDGPLDETGLATIEALRENLREMALAQSHQDLGGQIIRRVASIVRGVHEGFGELGLHRFAVDERPSSAVSGPEPAGKAIVDPAAVRVAALRPIERMLELSAAPSPSH